MILVVSTGYAAPSKFRCLGSVASQKGVDFRHVYIDAAEQPTPRGAMQNQYEAIVNAASPDDIVALVDGDDWLPHPGCLARVQAEHDAGAWMTWGSFQFSDGRAGSAAPHEPGDDVRSAPWRMSHLKTFRASLFRRIDPEPNFKRDGDWLVHARDLAVMFPLYELCPPERRRFIPETIYTYDLAASFEWTALPGDLLREQEDVAYVRSLDRLAPVVSL